jgi:hypothetical protein
MDSRRFGKRFVLPDTQASESPSSLGAELKLFAATFLAGFVFVSILIA